MATTKVKDSRQKKLTTTPTPAPPDSRRQTTRPSPSSSTKSSRSTSPTSPKRGRPFVPSSTGTKPLPNYLRPTESSRTISSARLADSSSKHIKKHTTTTATTTTAITTGHDAKAASNRRRSIDRSTSSSALPSSHHVHTKVGTSVPPIRERLATRSTSFASRPASASHRVQSKAPIATTTVSNKSHGSSGSGKGTLKKATTATKKEVLENESSNALEKVSGVAGIGDEQQMPSAEAIEELKDVEQNKVGGNEEEIVQALEIPDYPESEDIIETEIENTGDDILEPVEESYDADQIKQTEETILEDKILEPEDDNNNTNHEDNGEQMDEVKGKNKSVSPPPAKSSSIEETESKAEEDNHKEDTDENLDHAVRREENPAPEVREEEEGKKEAETCNEKEEVVVVEEESPAAKSLPVEEEAPKTSIGASKGTAGKKDSPAYNDVIEETATKLLEKRKNKVKALVGAFETVISLDAN